MKHINKFFPTLLFFLLFSLMASSQEIVLKTNMPYWLTTTPNFGAEIVVSRNMSIELTTGYNPFRLGDEKRFKHWVIWPELRYWTYEPFNGHFIGLHGVGGIFNLSGWDLGIDKLNPLKNRRYQGSAFGAGVSYGYHWPLNSRWALELTAGVGFARFNFDSFTLEGDGGSKVGENRKNYFGPSKGAFSLVYSLR